MLHLVTNSVVHLPVFLGPVVVTGPHSQTGHHGTWSNVYNKPVSFSLQRPAYPQYSEQPSGWCLCSGRSRHKRPESRVLTDGLREIHQNKDIKIYNGNLKSVIRSCLLYILYWWTFPCQGYSFFSTPAPPTIRFCRLAFPQPHWVSLLTRQTGRVCWLRDTPEERGRVLSNVKFLYSAWFCLQCSSALVTSHPANLTQLPSTSFQLSGHRASLSQRRAKSLGSVSAMARPIRANNSLFMLPEVDFISLIKYQVVRGWTFNSNWLYQYQYLPAMI